MSSASQWIVLAHVLRPQGRKGEVLADLFTDFPERFVKHPQVWLAPSGFAERTMDVAPQSAEVTGHWLPVGRNAGRIVLQIAGIDSIDKARQIAGKDVVVPLANRMPLAEGTAYISDLIGCTVSDGGRELGVVEAVEFPATPDGSRRLEEAAPLLSLKASDGGEILVPFAAEFLRELDVQAKSIRMDLPSGLAEINNAGGKEEG